MKQTGGYSFKRMFAAAFVSFSVFFSALSTLLLSKPIIYSLVISNYRTISSCTFSSSATTSVS